MSNPLVFVNILNWNGKEDTLECLESIRHLDYPNFKVLVIDNGSADDSVAVLSSMQYVFPFEVLETYQNLGYSGGNNIGLEYAFKAGADYVLILNNDTVVDKDMLSCFMSAVDKYPDAGAMGALSYYYNDRNVVWAAGGKWDDEICEVVHIGNGEIDDGTLFNSPFEVEYVIGCALIVSKQAFAEVGGMDDRFFLNFEENDWCRRIGQAGYKVLTVPHAKIWHKVGSSFGGESPIWKYFMTRNELLWASKNLSQRHVFKITLKLIKRALPWFNVGGTNNNPYIKRLFWACRIWVEQLRQRCVDPFYQAQFWGIAHYYLGRFGDCPADLKRKLLSDGNATSE